MWSWDEVLTFGGVLETTVYDSAEDLGLEQEVTEAGAVNGHVRSLHVLLGGLRNLRNGGLGLLLLLVVQKIVIISHRVVVCV